MPDQTTPHFLTLAHDRYRRTVIRAVAVHEWERGRNHIPGNVMLVGEDWVYLANLTYTAGGEGVYMLTPVELYGIQQACAVPQIVRDMRRLKFGKGDISLMPEGEQRMREARELGEIVAEDEFSFRIPTPDGQITVYRMVDAQHCIRDTDVLPDGTRIGITEIKR